MQDFSFYNPTKYIFGKTALDSLESEVGKLGKKVLVIYGGGSIKKNGLYERVIDSLSNCEVKEFSGIEPNPRIETLKKCIELARDFKPDLLLAVGGGSVIDGTKLIAAGINFEKDAWEIIKTKPEITWKTVPLAAILTISATGSEMNSGSVITNWETHEKDYFQSDKVRPIFSIVDPQVQFSLPKDQIANGIVDAYSHVLEQYINDTFDAPLQDRFAEGILLTLIENGPVAIEDITNYEARSNIVYAATMALNNLIGMGVNQDWATHEMEHVVSGHFDIPHGAGLAIIHPRTLEVLAMKDRLKKLVKYGKRVWNLNGSDEEIARNAIQKTYDFFSSLGMKMTFTEWGISKEETLEVFVKDSVKRGQEELPLTEEQIREVLSECY